MLSAVQEQALYDAIGLRIQELRKGQLTQEELGDLVGLSRASIANLEAGRQRTSLHHLYAIAEALDVNVGDVLPEGSVFALRPDEVAVTTTIEVVADGRELSPSEREMVARLLLSHDKGPR